MILRNRTGGAGFLNHGGDDVLILAWSENDEVYIEIAGQRLRVVVLEIDRHRVRLGFDGPLSVKVTRGELLQPALPREVER